MRKNVLLVPTHAASLQEMLLLAEEMQRASHYFPVVILQDNCSIPSSIQTEGITFVNLPSERDIQNRYAASSPVSTGRVRERLRNLIRKNFAGFPFRTLNQIWKLLGLRAQSRRLFQRFEPAAVVLTGDREYGLPLAIISEANRRERLVLLIPFAISDISGQIMLRRDKPEYWVNSPPLSALKHRLALRYPGQVYRSRQGSLLFYTPDVTVALKWLGMLPDNPWVMGGGNSHLVGVIGQVDRQRYIEAGATPEKLVITGQPGLDELYRSWEQRDALRKKLLDTYKLDPTRPILAAALPQLAEHGVTDWNTHWQEIKFLSEELAQTTANVLLSLHPKSDVAQYRFLEETYNLRILNEPLRQVLAAADLFVATYSSTIRWAVLMGIPAIVVDFNWFGYDLFDGYDDVIIVNDREMFADTLKQLLSEEEFNRSIQREHHRFAAHLAPFDGKTCRRVIELIDRYIKNDPLEGIDGR